MKTVKLDIVQGGCISFKGKRDVKPINCAYIIKNMGQIPGHIHADFDRSLEVSLPPLISDRDLFVDKTKMEVSEGTAIATGFHDPGRSYKDWSYILTKPKREVSGDNSPGHICADLSAIAAGFHDPSWSYKDWSYTLTKAKREVSGDNSPGHIHADLSANSIGVSRPPSISDRTNTSTGPNREVSGSKIPGFIWHGLIGDSLGVLISRPSMTMDLNNVRSTTKIERHQGINESNDTDLKW